MFGDLIGITACRSVTLPGGATRVIRVPIASAGAFKIADNESPRPQDRAFVTYNYFDNLSRSLNSPEIPRIDLHREVIGFEKTFLDGDASIGLRLPFIEMTGGSGIEDSQIGDLSVVLKYAFINDRSNLGTGNVLSGGLVVTAPTGKDFIACTGDRIHPTLLQPYVGYIWGMDNFFIHGFTSVEVPTDWRDVVLLSNDIGVGYWLRRDARDQLVSGIVPTFEAHVNNPLNHRGAGNNPVGVPDDVNLTTGVRFLFAGGSSLGAAIAVPVAGPKPYDLEAIVQFNFRF
jgi:hypothetical protein